MRWFRGLDAKFILAVAFLIASVTICYGFYDRGQKITQAEQSVQELSSQVDRLLDENQRLHDQITHQAAVSAKRARAAEHQREVLRIELARLIDVLQAHGLAVPPSGGHVAHRATAHRSPQRHATSTGSSAPAPSPTPTHQHFTHHQTSPGHSAGHAHQHGHSHQHHGHQSSLPSLPLPSLVLPTGLLS